MKKIISLFFCITIFSCTNTDEKKEIIIEEFKDKVVVAPILVEDNLVFTVQIAALKNPNDKLASIVNVYIYDEDDLLKYRFGSFKTYAEAKIFRTDLKIKYQGVFVQAMLNDLPISITDALQY